MSSKNDSKVFSIRLTPNDERILKLVTKSMGNPSKASVLKMLLHLKATDMGINTDESESMSRASA